MNLSNFNNKINTRDNVKERILKAVRNDPSIKVIGRGTVVVDPESVISQMREKVQQSPK